ncbi:aldehyde ferredoxin oxidoreductase N-terminal domain-containing protein [Plantactinospora sp. B5E13]|uniref:aldehyde ferredoxin oxidoreductase N-terminal domain-containing protein n=1 Tax=Plantactinospora sp. B5E13 TaxID=3153758 RepID=UPI00325E8AC9
MVLIHVDLGAGPPAPPAGTVGRPGAGGPAGVAVADDDLGGPVAALRVLHDAVTGPTEPADAPVALVAGSVAGTPGPGLARCAAIGLSPLSGGVAETGAEGPFGAGLRAAGVTGVVLQGRAAGPSVVVVEAGRARLEPADRIWGLETGPATDALLDRYGPDAAVAVIGPAGEHGVRYASIVTCRDHPLPRLGLGAVLGGKRVKAVVCRPGTPPRVADPAALARIGAWYASAQSDNPLTAWQHGTPGFGVWTGDPGYAPVANFADTRTAGGIGVAPPVERVAACPGCPTDCIKVFAGAGLHQEALAMLGPNLGLADPWPVHARCLQLGLDPVSLGGTLAAVGTPAGEVAATVEQIGAGADPLGEGAARVAPGSAMTSKGIELPPFDPRVQPNLGLGYAVAPIGPRYDIIEHDLDFDPEQGLPHSYPELARLGVRAPRPRGELDVTRTAQLMRLWSGLDALGICPYAATPTRPLTLDRVEELVRAVTGVRPDVLALGARRLRLQRAVNRRVGLGLDADTLPDRFFTEPVAAGRYAGAVLDRTAFGAAVARLQDELGFTDRA